MNEEVALTEACERGDVALCLCLLNQGVDPNARAKRGETPLIAAAKANKVDIISALMLMKEWKTIVLDVTCLDNQGFTAFHWAVLLGHVDVLSVMTHFDRSLLFQSDALGRTILDIFSLLRPNQQRWYPTDMHLLEKQSDNSNRAKSLSKRSSCDHRVLRSISLSCAKLFGKRSRVLQKVPFCCFTVSLCVALAYNVLFFMRSSYVPNPILLINVIGQACIWYTFLGTLNAIPKALPTVAYCKFSNALVLRVEASQKQNEPTVNVCYRCRILLTDHIGHCNQVQRCLVNFDHFCVFLWSPIHSSNIVFFFFYLVSMFLSMPFLMYSLLLHIQYCVKAQEELAYDDSQRKPTFEIRFSFAYILWVFVMWIFVSVLLLSHTQSIKMGQTSRQKHCGKIFANDNKEKNFLQNLYDLSSVDSTRCSLFSDKVISNGRGLVSV